MIVKVQNKDVFVAREYGVPVPEYVGPERVAEGAAADHRVVSTDADAVGDLPRRDDPAATGAGRRVGLRDGVRGDAPLVDVNDALVLRLTKFICRAHHAPGTNRAEVKKYYQKLSADLRKEWNALAEEIVRLTEAL